jgi:hypothetical protein
MMNPGTTGTGRARAIVAGVIKKLLHMNQFEDLVSELLDCLERREEGWCMNELLTRFQQGDNLDHLSYLLQHPDGRIAHIGSWVAAELGRDASPIIDVIFSNITHSSASTRMHSIDSLAIILSDQPDEYMICRCIQSLDDVCQSVRWKVLDFMIASSRRSLECALDGFRSRPMHEYADGVWLLLEGDLAAIRNRLTTGSYHASMFALAAGLRTTSFAREVLDLACKSSYQDVARYANVKMGSLDHPLRRLLDSVRRRGTRRAT